jgi:hypothetical protein
MPICFESLIEELEALTGRRVELITKRRREALDAGVRYTKQV